MPGFNADLYQKYHKIWPTGFAKVAVQSVQAVLLPLSNNSSIKDKRAAVLRDCGFLCLMLLLRRRTIAAGNGTNNTRPNC